MKTNIKPKHEALIRHFLTSDPTTETEIQGRKLIALHRLIQMKRRTDRYNRPEITRTESLSILAYGVHCNKTRTNNRQELLSVHYKELLTQY